MPSSPSAAASPLQARHPREEAERMLGVGQHARVLEPSPPAVAEEPWLADDPVADGPAGAVGPVPGLGRTWAEVVTERPELTAWAGARWLAAHRPLRPAPPGLVAAREALHRLAVYVLSPARRRANGKIGLRWTLGGVGTPFFGADEQVRVAGAWIVRQRGGEAGAEPITTLAEAAAFALDGPPDLAWAEGLDVPPPGALEAALDVDAEAATFLGEWFGFAWSVLEAVRADPESCDAGRVQLWPEHFDAAFDCVPPGSGGVTFGASPGDQDHPAPYLYVLPADPEALEPGETWNATAFRGAILPLGDLLAAADQRGAACAFLRSRRAALRA